MARNKKTGPADAPLETAPTPSGTQATLLVIASVALAAWILALVVMAAFT